MKLSFELCVSEGLPGRMAFCGKKAFTQIKNQFVLTVNMTDVEARVVMASDGQSFAVFVNEDKLYYFIVDPKVLPETVIASALMVEELLYPNGSKV